MKILIKTFSYSWKASKPLFITVILGSLLVAVLPAIQVRILAFTIDHFTEYGSLPHLILLVSLVLLIAISAPVMNIFDRLSFLMGDQVSRYVNSKTTLTVAQIPPNDLTGKDIQALLGRLKDQVGSVSNLTSGVLRSATALATGILLIAAMWSYSWVSAILVVLAFVPIVFVAGRMMQFEIKLWPQIGEHSRKDSYLKNLLYNVRTAKEISNLGSGHFVANKANKHFAQVANVQLAVIKPLMLWNLFLAVVGLILFGAVIYFLVTGVGAAGAIAGAIVAALAGIDAVKLFGVSIGYILENLPKAKEVEAFLERYKTSKGSVHEAKTQAVELTVKNATFTYPERKTPALQNVDLRLKVGQSLAIVGKNGAGKSTLSKVIMGELQLDQDNSGEAFFTDINQAQIPCAQHGIQISYLDQNFEHYEFTVNEFLTAGRTEPIPDEHILKVLEEVGVLHALGDDPLNAQLGEQWGGIELSGGQWQRLAIARVLIGEEKVWVFDEPTSAIDAESEVKLLKLITQNAQDRMLILITHRAWSLKELDNIVVLDDAQLVESGTFSQLYREGTKFHQLFSEQELS